MPCWIRYFTSAPRLPNLNSSRRKVCVVEQLIRPTGILDPLIEVRPCATQVDDLLDEIHKVVERDERVLVTTLTKRMAEELAKYPAKLNVRCRYIHSEVDTTERVEILRQLRVGMFDVLIGINLSYAKGWIYRKYRWWPCPDADKEGFLRNERSLVQTVGRAARNVNGKVIMYADKITDSMRQTMNETERRRKNRSNTIIKITLPGTGRSQKPVAAKPERHWSELRRQTGRAYARTGRIKCCRRPGGAIHEYGRT